MTHTIKPKKNRTEGSEMEACTELETMVNHLQEELAHLRLELNARLERLEHEMSINSERIRNYGQQLSIGVPNGLTRAKLEQIEQVVMAIRGRLGI